MRLIGLLDSPYVRRVAISLQLLGLRFEHQSISVFRAFDEFEKINPVVKAPTMVLDDGTVLMDSTIMLEYAEAVAHPRSLVPTTIPELGRDLRIVSLALAACEKSIQIVYEHELRPAERQHQPWVDRVTGQLLAACDLLEGEFRQRPMPAPSAAMSQASVTAAVTWHFVQKMIPEVVPHTRCPLINAYSLQAECLPEFKAAPHGDSTFGYAS